MGQERQEGATYLGRKTLYLPARLLHQPTGSNSTKLEAIPRPNLYRFGWLTWGLGRPPGRTLSPL